MFKLKVLLKYFLVIFITYTSFSTAYSQTSQELKEIDEAVLNALSGNYQQAIPVLEKYANRDDFNELKILEINIYLNSSYLATENDAIAVEKVNTLIDNYLINYEINKNESFRSSDEVDVIYSAGIFNKDIGNAEKMIQYFSLIKNHYEKNFLKKDQTYFVVLILLSHEYCGMQKFEPAIELGEIAWKLNLELFEDKKEVSLTILDILYSSYQKTNESLKSIEFLKKYIEISKEIYGEQNLNYIASLYNLSMDYSNIGQFREALNTALKVVELYKKVLGEKHPDYIKSLNSLALAYSNNGEDQKALEICQVAVELSKEVLGERHIIYLNCLNNLSSVYLDIGNYPKALETNLKVVELTRIVLGEKHPDYLKRLGSLALVYSKKGHYQKALELNLTVLESLKNTLGEVSPDYLTCLSNLAVVYSKLGDYQKALELNIKVADIRKEVFGEKHPDYLTSLANIASVYSSLGNYNKALEIAQRETKLIKEVLGEKHPAYFTSLSNLSYIYSYAGDYKKALEISLEASVFGKENFGITHPTYLNSLINLAGRYSQIGDYKNALEIYTDAEKLFLQVFGDNHPNYFNLLGGLSSINLKLGNYRKALTIKLKETELRNVELGDEHPEYLTCLSSLASVYLLQGDYMQALDINLKSTKLLKEVLGESHPDYLTSLSNLALIYYSLGAYSKALNIDLEVLEMQKKFLGEKHPFILTTMNNLSLVYSETKKFQKALEFSQETVEIAKEILGEIHPYYLNNLATLSVIYSNLGEFKKALEINLQVANIRKEVLGERHPDYLMGLGNLASNYSHLGDYSKSLEINRKVANSIREVLGEANPNYAICLINLAVSEYKLSQIDSALSHYIEMIDLTQEKIINYFSIMTELQREKFWEKSNNYFGRFPLFLEKVIKTHSEGATDAYNIALFLKGLLLNTTLDFESLIAESGTPEAIEKFEELKLLKLQIQRLQERPLAERYLNVDSLENIAQLKESELVKLSKEYGDYTRNLKITWEDVQANLLEKDVAIEFVEYPTLSDTVKYAALVLRKGWQYPKMISLFCKNEMEDYIQQDMDKIYSYGYVGKQLKKYIWEPLEEFISPGERVYFSPAGIIHQLAIENLAWNDSTILGERYQMHRLSSTKELVVQQPESKSHSAVIYGGLDYSLDSVDMIAGSKKFETIDNIFALTRGYSSDYSERSGWNPINGTGIEAEQINRMLSDKNYQVDLYTGKAGIEESFKALSGKGNSIIHIATHGFFLPIEESRQNPFVLQRIGDEQPARATIDPMLRSGLIMAGGNKAWLGKSIPDNIEDGVLTAKEISHVDLSGTDMVVLSACETGLGEISSEGVFGLQRSFKQAGVKTIVMSLWKVNDEATKYMMTEFYARLLAGKEKREAFLEAKQKCREKYIDPRYWAAFIMLN